MNAMTMMQRRMCALRGGDACMERMVCKRLMCGDECNDVYVDVVECCFRFKLERYL